MDENHTETRKIFKGLEMTPNKYISIHRSIYLYMTQILILFSVNKLYVH